jgi:hypothetical protein
MKQSTRRKVQPANRRRPKTAQEKSAGQPTTADFIRRSREYRLDVDIDFDRPLPMDFPVRKFD